MMIEITSRNTHLAMARPPGAGALPSYADIRRHVGR
jgi:hypothetical protein